MQKPFYLFFMLLLIVTGGYAQNRILAGQTTGDNIHFIDFVPDSSVHLFNSGDNFLLDIDHNGTNDLAFSVFSYYDPSWYFSQWSTVTLLNEKVKILSHPGAYALVDKLEAGDTISPDQTWDGTDIIYNFKVYYQSNYPPNSPDTTYGGFDTGYLGFRIDYPGETFFGWIHISATTTSIIAKETAVCGITVGTKNTKKVPVPLKIYPNPCRDAINLDLKGSDTDRISYQIVGCSGRTVSEGVNSGNKTRINTSGLIPGVYLIRVIKGDEIFRAKFVKEEP